MACFGALRSGARGLTKLAQQWEERFSQGTPSFATATTSDQLHAYQVKWTIADAMVSFADFKKLFAGLVSICAGWAGRPASRCTATC